MGRTTPGSTRCAPPPPRQSPPSIRSYVSEFEAAIAVCRFAVRFLGAAFGFRAGLLVVGLVAPVGFLVLGLSARVGFRAGFLVVGMSRSRSKSDRREYFRA